MISEASPSGRRRPAGKHPTLRPKRSDTPMNAEVKQISNVKRSASKLLVPKKPKKQSKTQFPWQTATHRTVTRSQSKIFRILDLPPELRNLVHHHAAAVFSADRSEGLDLATLTLPPALSLSRQLRAEALPFFFSANHFKVCVKSNYCIFRRHFHHSEHVRYAQTGKITLSALLTRTYTKLATMSTFLNFDNDGDEADAQGAGEGKNDVSLKEEWIRFKRVTYVVDCVCCAPGKPIAKLELGVGARIQEQGTVFDAEIELAEQQDETGEDTEVVEPAATNEEQATEDQQQTTVEAEQSEVQARRSKAAVDCILTVRPRENFEIIKASMELMFVAVREIVATIGLREGFNGFTVADLRDVAACVSYDGGREGRGRGVGHE